MYRSATPVAVVTAVAGTVLGLIVSTAAAAAAGELSRPLQPTSVRTSLAPLAPARGGLDAAAGPDPGAQYFYSLDPQRGSYHFGYDTGPQQHQSFREETRHEDGAVHGSYGYVDSGVLRVTEYTADQRGYRCWQTVRYMVEPGRGVFVPAEKPYLTTGDETHKMPAGKDHQNSYVPELETALNHRPMMIGQEKPNDREAGLKQGRQGWRKTRLRAAQPARVLGKKVSGHYKDFTSEPAVGGTAAVSAWDSAHKSELGEDEVFGTEHRPLYQKHQQTHPRTTAGGSLVWPVTEDGMRVVWQPF